jgi:hypothetical protein
MTYRRDASQVTTSAADGTGLRHLGQYGHIGALVYSYALPGGADQFTATLIPAGAGGPVPRFTALDPGRIISVWRGGSEVWEGILDEPAPTAGGWTLSAHGAGTYGGDYMAKYSSYATAGQPVTNAIARTPYGLRWTAPASWPGDLYLDQPPDDASVTVTEYLNNVTGPAGYTWQVRTSARGNVLSIFTPPVTATRLLVATTAQARSLSGYYTDLWLRYQSAADNPTSGAAATFATTSVANTAQRARHGRKETWADLSSAGTKTSAAAQAVGTKLMARYQAASYAGPLVVRPGQLLNLGGVPVDLGCEQAGEVYRLILAGGGYGGEVTPSPPVQVLGGGYSWDDVAQQASITPYQYAASDLAGLLSNWVTLHTPKTAA